MTKQIQEALYIRDLILENESIKEALEEDNLENLWVKSACDLPDHYHSDIEPNYLELLAALDGFNCHDDPPTEAIDILRDYIEERIENNLQEIISFLTLRIDTIKENIKEQKKKFKKEYGIDYKVALDGGGDIVPAPKSSIKLDLDSILDKINEKGIDSLNIDEKKYLKIKGKNGKSKNSDKSEEDESETDEK